MSWLTVGLLGQSHSCLGKTSLFEFDNYISPFISVRQQILGNLKASSLLPGHFTNVQQLPSRKNIFWLVAGAMPSKNNIVLNQRSYQEENFLEMKHATQLQLLFVEFLVMEACANLCSHPKV